MAIVCFPAGTAHPAGLGDEIQRICEPQTDADAAGGESAYIGFDAQRRR